VLPFPGISAAKDFFEFERVIRGIMCGKVLTSSTVLLMWRFDSALEDLIRKFALLSLPSKSLLSLGATLSHTIHAM